MSSFEHEALVRLFRDDPDLAPSVLTRSLGLLLPAHEAAQTESADLTQLAPAEY
jgi:hypothetical protein